VSGSHALGNPGLRTLAGCPAIARAARRQLAAWRLALVFRRALARRPLLWRRQALVAERETRDLMGVPWRHPENVATGLRGGYQRRLDRLQAELWPANEYVQEL
jgi:hypothetical protein